MAELKERETKLVQYLNEAYGKEKELEISLHAHIQMTSRDSYKQRLKDHLKETKQQATGLQRRIRKLGGKVEATPLPGPDAVTEAAGAVTSFASKAVAAAKGPLHAVRGTSEQEVMLKNAKTEYWNEAEEIANYKAIEALATAVGDKETAKLARGYRREEERMQSYLERTIPQLTKDVVRAEIPANQRNGGKSTRRAKAASKPRAKAASKPRASKATSKARSATATSKARASKAGPKARGAKATSKARASKAGPKARGAKATSKARSATATSKARASKAGSKARGAKATSKGRASKAAPKARASKAASRS